MSSCATPGCFQRHSSFGSRRCSLQLKEELENDEEDEIHLGKNGYIILLKASGNLRSLNLAKLSSESGVFLRRAVEFVEKLDLGEVRADRRSDKTGDEGGCNRSPPKSKRETDRSRRPPDPTA